MGSPSARPVAAPAWAQPLFSVGVTGTNGKTSTTWMISAAVRAAAHPVLRISTLGVDLDDEVLPRGKQWRDFLATLELAARRGCRHAVIEATRFGRPLPKGGCIGVPAPASPWENRSDLLRGVEWWQARGYRVKLAGGIEARDS